MGEAETTIDVPAYGEPVVKSEVSTSNNPDGPAPTPPEPAKPVDAPKPADPEPKPRYEDPRDARIRQQNARIGVEARGREAAEARLAEYERRVAPPAEGAQSAVRTQADYDKDVRQAAERLATEQTFAAACNKIADAGAAEFKDDFTPTMTSLWNVVDGFDDKGDLTPHGRGLIEAVQEADNPAGVLYHLGKNLNEAQRIAGMTPAKMGAAIARLSDALAKQATSVPAVSQAPAPPESVSGTTRSSVALADLPMAEYIKTREAQIKARNAR